MTRGPRVVSATMLVTGPADSLSGPAAQSPHWARAVGCASAVVTRQRPRKRRVRVFMDGLREDATGGVRPPSGAESRAAPAKTRFTDPEGGRDSAAARRTLKGTVARRPPCVRA